MRGGERERAAGPGVLPGPDCFHCALPIPAGTSFGFESGGGWRAFCCAGCEAVSRSISGLGLEDYYRLRAAAAPRVEEPRPDLAVFDDPRIQAPFVREAEGGGREAQLIVEGLRCAACAWLVEQSVARLAGVAAVQVNYATRRATVRWSPAALPVSRILGAVAAVGYAAWPYEEGRLDLVEGRERRTLLRRLWIAGLGMMQVMMYAVPAYVAPAGEVSREAESLMRWAGLVLTLPVMLFSAAPFFTGALRDLRLRRLGMDVPVALGLAAAFAASAAATLMGEGAAYFDSIAMFVFLIAGGRYLELAARSRAARSLQRLAKLVPRTALRLRSASSLEADTVPVSTLAAADRVLVRPGDTVPADGEVESETAVVGEAWLSGESRPLTRISGQTVLGGSVNAGSAFVLRVSRVGAETALSGIHRLMERALAERPRWVEGAQRAAHAFVAFVLLAALAAAALWWAIEPSRALWIAVSVLIVTCPCALALAAPVASTVATGALARTNVVVSRGHAIEALAGATDFVFDKTGTLTHGELELLETLPLGALDRSEALVLAAALARASAHPVDAALWRAAPARHASASAHRSEPGMGIEALAGGRRVRLGRASFAGALHGKSPPLAWIGGAETVAWLADEHGWIAAFRFGDRVRPEAAGAMDELRRLGIALHMLSGDEPAIVERLAAELHIPDPRSRASPAAKRAYVKALQAGGAKVAMVGDGINDAPVLAQADVSVAMGGGADLAQVRADAVLLSDSLADLARGVRLARKARRVVRQNLAWALAYNLVVVPLAFAGMVTPLVAGIGMSASSLVVVANALRLRS